MCRYPIRLSSGSSEPYAENAWTARYSGPPPTWRPSCSTTQPGRFLLYCIMLEVKYSSVSDVLLTKRGLVFHLSFGESSRIGDGAGCATTMRLRDGVRNCDRGIPKASTLRKRFHRNWFRM